MNYSGNWLSVCLADDLPENHSSRVIIHDGSGFFFATYSSMGQLREFAEAVGGFTWTLDHVDTLEYRRVGSAWEKCAPYQIECCTLSHKFNDIKCHWWPGNELFHGMWCESFWKSEEIPSGAFPIVGLSNGSLVRCYATNDGETIGVYRPNPNAKAVYKPLTLEAHLAYMRAHGSMGPCDPEIESAAVA